MFVASSYLEDTTIRSSYFTYNLEYSVRSAQLLNSPTCFAYEQQYTTVDGITRYKVLPGIIDFDKFTNGISSTCMEGSLAAANLTLFDVDGMPLPDTYVAGATPDNNWKSYKHKYFVIVRDGTDEYNGLMEFQLKNDE